MSKKNLSTYQRWNEIGKTVLEGKTIVKVNYIDKEEAEVRMEELRIRSREIVDKWIEIKRTVH